MVINQFFRSTNHKHKRPVASIINNFASAEIPTRNCQKPDNKQPVLRPTKEEIAIL